MSRIIFMANAAICAVIFSACTATENQNSKNKGQLIFYVSPEGNDDWSGRKATSGWFNNDGPFKTISAAQKAIRTLKATDGTLKQPVTVMLDGGFYCQQEELVFTPEDSGSAECPVTYTARSGDAPVISGGFPLTGWQTDDSEQSRRHCDSRLLKLKMPENPAGTPWNFNQLYINGESRIRARSPDKGCFFRSAGPTGSNENREFFYNEGDVIKWRNPRQVLVTVYHSWETSLHHIHAIDTDSGIITLREPAPWPMGRWEKQQRYYVEGIFEGLDQPGEWYLDTSEDTLYYYPMPGEKPSSINAVVPLICSPLLSFKGEPSKNKYVENIQFKGISFQHTDANLKVFRNPGQGEIYQPGLITATGLRNSSIENCEISCADAHAIWLMAGCSNNTVRQCHMHSLGGGGVYIGEATRDSIANPTTGNTVDNCYIHNAGNLFHGAHGVWIGRSSYNKVTHNEICNLDYSGISCGWSWGFQPTSANHNILDYNHIHHLSNGEGLSDMGGIYTLGISPGTTERYNHIHDVYNYEHVSHGSGLYPDEGSSNILMENNVVYKVRNSPLFMHYGADCDVRNNILALGDKGILRRSREDKRCHYNAVCNIVYSDHPEMMDGPWKNKDWHVERNLYWSTTGKPDFAGRDFTAWQAEGNDKGSLVADPLFVNPAEGNFTLKEGSPASKIGFKPIDISHTGLYGDKDWVSLPSQYPDRKLVKIARPVEVPISINYDFEGLEPGSKPIDAKVHESGAAIVSVVNTETEGMTVEAEGRDLGGGVQSPPRLRPASMAPAQQRGKQCLKFQDAPGVRYRWYPHLEYMRTYTNGTVTLSWDMLNSKEKPAEFIVELRDYSSGNYKSGPQISVNPKGEIKASGRKVGDMPADKWVNVKIQLICGDRTEGTYKLEISIPGKAPVIKTIPFANPEFRNITWLGLMGNSEDNAVFYIDNLRMGTAEELADPPHRRIRRIKTQNDGIACGKDRLAGYWNFDDECGYTVTDLSGCGNIGDMWARPAKGSFGNAVYMDETAAYIHFADSPSLHFGKDDFSISLWICPAKLEINSTNARRRFISKNGHPSTWWNMNLSPDGRILMELADDAKHHFGCGSNTGIPLKRWSLLTVTVNRTAKAISFYINGTPDSTCKLPESFSGSLDVPGKDLTLGSTWQPFIGLMDEVKFFKRVLTPQEIEQDYTRFKNRYSDAEFRIIE